MPITQKTVSISNPDQMVLEMGGWTANICYTFALASSVRPASQLPLSRQRQL